MEYQRLPFACVLSEYRDYAAGIRLADTYWESLVREAAVYRMEENRETLGYASVCTREDWEENGYLTSFFVREPARHRAAALFAELLRRLRPAGAYVVTGDELLLSLCADVQKSMRTRALFFDYAPHAGIRPAEFPAALLRRAQESDLPDLEASGFYESPVRDTPENRLYVLRDAGGHYLGTGHIARMQLERRVGAVGMCTAPEHRNRGVGRSIILALTAIAREEGLLPIAGCLGTNTASRATLESCGFVSRTRYLKFEF